MTENTSLITRNGLIWLLIAQILSVAPLLFYLPWWILGLWLGCAIWRVQIYRMKFGYPPRLVKIILMTIIGIGIYFSRGSIIGLEGGLVLLVAAFSLKLIELKTKRDAIVIIYIGFLVVTTLYLYDNSIIWVSYSFLPVITLLAALVGLNQVRLAVNPLANIKLVCLLLVQALPLILLLFFFFPRLEPIWTLPTPKKQQTTGITNKMTPGEMADMARSSELVLRAVFEEGKIPSRKQLYWRVLTLEHYNGRIWNQAWDLGYRRYRDPNWTYIPDNKNKVDYTVIMQPSLQNWLIALETPLHMPKDTIRAPDFHLERNRPVDTVYSYQLTSWLESAREPNGSRRIKMNKELPNSDPRATKFGQQLQETHKGDTNKIVQSLLKYFHEQPYFYTLDTPDLGENSVDSFFFDTKKGFCEHYAGATTFILRAAGVPSRVVLGYQGGEINTVGNFVQVRQSDAHAWVEYWEQGKGWIMIDPTFEVAPARINVGLNEALNPTDQLQAGNNALLGYGSSSLLSKLRMRWENFNNEWDIFISSYSADRQRDVLKQLLGKANLAYLGILLVIGILIITIIWLLLLFKPWKIEKNFGLRYYQQFERLLAIHGVSRKVGEGPVEFAKRAMEQLPDYQVQINEFTRAFISLQYAELSTIQDLKASLYKLKKALPSRKYFK